MRKTETNNMGTSPKESRSTLKSKNIQYCIIFIISIFLLVGCKGPYVTAEVSGSIGTFKLTNNGTDEITILDNGLHLFPDSLSDGAPYKVEVVPRSDTSEGQLCAVTDGSNGDGSGRIINNQSVTVLVDCVGI